MSHGSKHRLTGAGAAESGEGPAPKSARTEGGRADASGDIYYEEDGLQRVHPYFHKYASHAKGRWVGRTLFDVFSREFRDRSTEYYEAAIGKGLIEINGKRVSKDSVVQNNDLITHHIHRHEPPVSTQPLRIVKETEDGLLVVDKPASIPVHPSGRYNYNSVTQILEVKHGYKKVFPINRLDRLTSGLLLVGLNADVARSLERNLREHSIQKEYVCKVAGDFPRGRIVCDEPIRVVAHKLGLNCVDREQGKPSLTEFEWLCADGEHSIVYCRPKTGRTHQIRVHLQFLGYPIANDPLYHNIEVWGQQMGKGGALPEAPEQQSGEDASEKPASTPAEPVQRPTKMVGKLDDDQCNRAWKHLVARMAEWKDQQNQAEHERCCAGSSSEADSGMCSVCACPDMADPTADELCIWLHAWRYSGRGWSYETQIPAWAQGAADLVDRVKYRAEPEPSDQHAL
ncbi:DRAP deaminase [Coemansia biformis]|uniref:Pseudouridine synthase n=1 Tax=Coemansia biformis TaxID=1286918 RepID=A0A9W7Y6D3_9FUNG|nr:DRAP deaminase [Coemansia biformis]